MYIFYRELEFHDQPILYVEVTHGYFCWSFMLRMIQMGGVFS